MSIFFFKALSYYPILCYLYTFRGITLGFLSVFYLENKTFFPFPLNLMILLFFSMLHDAAYLKPTYTKIRCSNDNSRRTFYLVITVMSQEF